MAEAELGRDVRAHHAPARVLGIRRSAEPGAPCPWCPRRRLSDPHHGPGAPAGRGSPRPTSISSPESSPAPGFRGGLNWYRNIDRNWELLAPYAGARSPCPRSTSRATGTWWSPSRAWTSSSRTSSEFIPELRKTIMLPGCGHWTQQERPKEVNDAMIAFLPPCKPEETSMGHTLEQLAAKMHDILAAEPGPAGREKVRALVEEVLSDEAFVAQAPGRRRAGAQDPLRGSAARLLHPRPRLPGRAREQAARSRPDLGHLRPGARRDAHERLGPRRAGERGEAREGAARPELSPEARDGPRLQRGRSPLPAPRRADPPHPHRGHGTWTRSSGWPTRRSERTGGPTHERQSPLRRLRHAHHGAARSLRAVPGSEVPRAGDPPHRGRRPARSAARS